MNLPEQVRNHRYGRFELTEEQIGTLCAEQPELVTVVKGTMLALEPSTSEEQNLHWATDNLDSLIAAIRKMRRKLQTKMTGKWRMRVYPPEFVEPLCRVGFEVHSHYMDYWLYDLLEQVLGVTKDKVMGEGIASDFGRLAEISSECASSPGWLEEPPEWFVDWSSDPNSSIFVAETDFNLVGYCCTQLYGFDAEKGTVVWIRSLAVAPTYQGLGFGRALLLAGLQWGQKSGARRSYLAVDKRNHIARRLYESIGFRPNGEEEINLILQ